jgi:glycosyltransferase involved in cell wall biosynthesis
MRVALFVSSFLPYSQTFIHDEIRFHQRYAVDVFTARRANPDCFPHASIHVAGPLYRWLNVSPRFTRELRSGRHDLVHAHFGVGGARAAGFARRAGLPLVITFHGYDVPLLTSLRRLTPEYWGYALLARRTLRQMTLGLCASEELYEMLRDYGVPAERLRIWRLGVDLERFSAGERDPDDPTVMMIGRFVEKKGFGYGVRAFASHVGGGRPGRLVIVGDGEGEARLRLLVEELGIAPRVTFTGPLAAPDVQARLRAADILMCPSVTGVDGDRESGLIVAKEASASRVVPLGTWHGGIHEIIEDGRTGFLVPERNVTVLSDRLARLMLDPALRARFGAAARVKMEREYDIRDRVTALEQHYDEARARFA